MQRVVTGAPVFISALDGKLFLNSFSPPSSRLSPAVHAGVVRVLCLGREEESLCADKLLMEYSESTVAPEASRRPRGRDSGGGGGKQCDGGWRGRMASGAAQAV